MSGRGCRTTLRIFGTGGQGTYAVRCTASRGRLQSRSRVKSGNSHVAPILSGLHLSADVGRRAARLRSRAPATAGIGGGRPSGPTDCRKCRKGVLVGASGSSGSSGRSCFLRQARNPPGKTGPNPSSRRAGAGGYRLAELLKKHGLASVANKISRRTFSATSFLASLKAIGCEQVALKDIQVLLR